jgi:cytochrome P450
MTKHWFSDVKAFQLDPLALLSERALQSDDQIFPLALGPAPVFFVNDPALVKPLMKTNEEILDKGRLVKKISSVVGESSLTLSGEAHKKRRAVLHERMSRGVANTYIGEMAANIRAVSAQLAKENTFRADIVGGTLALKLASVALFGHRVLSPGDELAIMSAFHTLEADLQAAMFRFLPRSPWKYFADQQRKKNALRTMDIVIRKVTSAASESSVLLALREASMSDDEIRNELTTMIIAGFHTTGSAVAWICHYLANQPEIVDSIRREHKSVSDETGEIISGRLNDAKISLAFVKEVLRLYPSAWWLTRELKQDLEFNNQKFKSGTTFIIAPWVYHRNPKYFENPNAFSLNREHSGAAYLPFGVGHRACVGMGVSMLELHLIVLEMASTFNFTQLTPASKLKPRAGITLNAPEMNIGVIPVGLLSHGLEEAA